MSVQSIRRVKLNGKFEGEDATTLYAYDASSDSTDVLSDGNGGTSHTRLDGPFDAVELRRYTLDPSELCSDYCFLNRAERQFIAMHVGCVVTESSDGFISVAWFIEQRYLDSYWDRLSKEFDTEDDMIDTWNPHD